MNRFESMTDEMLVMMYAQGTNAAFDTLLNRYKSSIHSYIYFIVRNRELAEDIFQETFVKVIITIKQGRYTDHPHCTQSDYRLFPSGAGREYHIQ